MADDRLTLGEADLDRVWLKSNWKDPTNVAHTDPDCNRLSNSEVVDKDPDVLDDDIVVCLVCLGEKPVQRNGNSGLWQELEAMDADALSSD